MNISQNRTVGNNSKLFAASGTHQSQYLTPDYFLPASQSESYYSRKYNGPISRISRIVSASLLSAMVLTATLDATAHPSVESSILEPNPSFLFGKDSAGISTNVSLPPIMPQSPPPAPPIPPVLPDMSNFGNDTSSATTLNNKSAFLESIRNFGKNILKKVKKEPKPKVVSSDGDLMSQLYDMLERRRSGISGEKNGTKPKKVVKQPPKLTTEEIARKKAENLARAATIREQNKKKWEETAKKNEEIARERRKAEAEAVPMTDTKSPRDIVCACTRPNIPLPVPGIPIGFWEPVRLVDVTKSPMCMVNLGGLKVGSSIKQGIKDDSEGSAFYHVHWYIYPVIYWLEILFDFLCLEMSEVDIAYLTEYDPLWGDDVKSSILNPESMLFKAASIACIADCISCSHGSLSNDAMFWCAGCQGGLYPFTGTLAHHNGGVGSSSLIVSKFIAKMHRELLLWGYVGKRGLCGKYPMPVIKKSQYRLQMTYPIIDTRSCKKIGESETTWQQGREFPVKGEDFGYLIWRKRDCCML